MIKVKAIKTGFFGGQLRIPGTPSESFEVKNRKEMGNWMVKVKPEGKPGGKPDSDDENSDLT